MAHTLGEGRPGRTASRQPQGRGLLLRESPLRDAPTRLSQRLAPSRQPPSRGATLKMKRLVVWGGAEGLESHRHIHRHFYTTALKMGIEAHWVRNLPSSRTYLTPGTTVLNPAVFGTYLGTALE